MTRQILPKQEIFLLSAIVLFLCGCFDSFNREPVSKQTIQVQEFEVSETIYKTEGWPDHIFERIYIANNNGETVELGRYSNEGDAGIDSTTPPIVQNGRLVVFSSAYVFILESDSNSIEFFPYAAEGWSGYAQTHRLNGHYDYIATDFWESGSSWLIAYDCVFCQDGKPEKLLFYSDDQGKSFTLCQPTAQDRICLANS